MKNKSEVLSQGYVLYLITFFLLLCPKGYENLILYKRNFLLIGFVVFILPGLIISFVEQKSKVFQNYKNKSLFFHYVLILVVFILSFLLSGNKAMAFWGDEYLKTGFVWFITYFLAGLLLKNHLKISKIIVRVFQICCLCEFGLQICQFCGIDLFKMTSNFSLNFLRGTLGSLNQNGVFCSLAYFILVCLFFYSNNFVDKIVNFILVYICVVAGIAINSAIFLLNVFVCIPLFIWLWLKHPEYLLKFWGIFVSFILALITHSIAREYYTTWLVSASLESLSLFLMKKEVILILIFSSLAVLFIGCLYLLFVSSDYVKSIVLKVYTITICSLAILLIFFLCTVSLINFCNFNIPKDSLFSKLIINDSFGTGRGLIWKISMQMYKILSIPQKLFGIGFNNYSNVYIMFFFTEEIYKYSGSFILADAHNAYLDMLISSGIIGCMAYFSFIIRVLIKNLILLLNGKNQKKSFIYAGSIVIFLVSCFLNSQMLVITPLVWVIVSLGWGNTECEE